MLTYPAVPLSISLVRCSLPTLLIILVRLYIDFYSISVDNWSKYYGETSLIKLKAAAGGNNVHSGGDGANDQASGLTLTGLSLNDESSLSSSSDSEPPSYSLTGLSSDDGHGLLTSTIWDLSLLLCRLSYDGPIVEQQRVLEMAVLSFDSKSISNSAKSRHAKALEQGDEEAARSSELIKKTHDSQRKSQRRHSRKCRHKSKKYLSSSKTSAGASGESTPHKDEAGPSADSDQFDSDPYSSSDSEQANFMLYALEICDLILVQRTDSHSNIDPSLFAELKEKCQELQHIYGLHQSLRHTGWLEQRLQEAEKNGDTDEARRVAGLVQRSSSVSLHLLGKHHKARRRSRKIAKKADSGKKSGATTSEATSTSSSSSSSFKILSVSSIGESSSDDEEHRRHSSRTRTRTRRRHPKKRKSRLRRILSGVGRSGSEADCEDNCD
ncbi:hypothetical protein OJ252_1483 [Cryptosporidium canis]|uniref:Uncharacterized protein n=1 Tax=Cryptosporidium canis TaxID=195482 RepID=A0ABQ8P7Z2_9CRYT|nr:hypothetical protein OJ252_1483 [Cryptosporidium canis]